MTIRVQVKNKKTNESGGRYIIPENEYTALKDYLVKKMTDAFILEVLGRSSLEPDDFRPWTIK